MRVAIFAWELGESSSFASASLRFTLGFVTVSASASVSYSASVSSSASMVIGYIPSASVTLADLLLEIGDGGHECLHMCHHGLVLVVRRCDSGKVLLQLLFSLLFSGF